MARRARRGAPLLVSVLDDLEEGRLLPTTQPDEGASLAPKITADDRVLDLARPAAELERRVRALSPHIGATCRIGGEPFKVWRVRARAEGAPPGLSTGDGTLLAGCAEGSLEMLELQPPGRGRMDVGAFLRGWRGGLEWGTG